LVRASRLSLLVVLLSALFMAGCMQTPAPVAGHPASDLDALAYGVSSCRGLACPGEAAVQPAAANANAYAAPAEGPYHLDAGDKLRIVVYGQEGLTNTYAVDAGGSITMPLIGSVRARGLTPAELAASITARLKKGYIREPYVAVEIEAYRPFFILGEVTAPGQYPYVPGMTVESAVAIAGGFTPRAERSTVKITRNYPAGPVTTEMPLASTLKPGDTALIGERWF
jgi:polysaccharide biosynthesis/export protein